MDVDDTAGIEQLFRSESGRAVASLVRFFGDIDVAEEAVQEAFVIALRRWPESGTPPNPAAWIITTARNRGLDRLRRESTRSDRQADATRAHELRHHDDDRLEEVGPMTDDRLRLIFTCCHPALARTAQVALTLRLVAGLQTPEIARAFLVPEATMAQRLVRAKRKIKGARIPYRVPSDAELPGRLGPVLAVLYLVFNEGHVASTGHDLTRADLCTEAVRLARLLVELMPDEAEAHGLLALLLLTESRRPARTTAGGSLVRLADQDRGQWDRELVAEGQAIVRACLRRNLPGPYQIQAAIAAVHSDAPTAEDTDWRQIVALYDQLMACSPTPVVALNRAIAVAEVHGPAAALELIDHLDLGGYHLFHAARADLLAKLGRSSEARAAYEQAIGAAANAAERALLEQRRTALTASEERQQGEVPEQPETHTRGKGDRFPGGSASSTDRAWSGPPTLARLRPTSYGRSTFDNAPRQREAAMDATVRTTEPASAYGHSPLITVDSGATLQAAAELLYQHDIGAVAVVKGAELVGVFSERDLVRAFAHGSAATEEVTAWMSNAPVTARPDDPVLDVALQMLEGGMRHLPLVDEYGRQTGMISLRDIERPLLLQAMTPSG